MENCSFLDKVVLLLTTLRKFNIVVFVYNWTSLFIEDYFE